MQQISLNATQIESVITQCRTDIRRQLGTLEQQYNTIRARLGNLDSEANAELQEAMQRNYRKAAVCAEVLERLITFIDRSSTEMQMLDQRESTRFSQDRKTVR
jgi:uncharacterized protein YukE